jgi:hypothetical protein
MSNAFIGKFGKVIYICCLNWDLNIANKFQILLKHKVAYFLNDDCLKF